jgi:hypothetical protein
MSDKAIIIDTPEQIDLYRLAVLKQALRLEAFGMKGRGRSAFAVVKELTGLKARSAKELLPKYIAWLEEKGV